MITIAMRHGHAADARAGGDRDRALTERGRAAARAMFERLRGEGLEPAVALVSAARRTRETFDQAPEPVRAACELVEDEALYNASGELIAERVAVWREASERPDATVLVIAHNPGITAFADAGAVLMPADAVVMDGAKRFLRASES